VHHKQPTNITTNQLNKKVPFFICLRTKRKINTTRIWNILLQYSCDCIIVWWAVISGGLNSSDTQVHLTLNSALLDYPI